ncbi:MAG: AAA family ATPase [Polyangiaceae bacterium]
MAIRETCSVCNSAFDVQFRYQMEEREGGFSFFCSQKCLEESHSQTNGATCEACAKRFTLSMAAQLFYVKGRRAYACSMECRAQVLREAQGARLGEMLAAPEASTLALPELGPSNPASGVSPKAPATLPASGVAQVAAAPQAPAAPQPAAKAAVVVPVVPRADRKPDARPNAVEARAARPAEPPPAAQTPRVLAVFNHKGGTGKTTTAVSVAAGLAMKGKRVLLVDTDAQGNVSVSLGASSERSLYHVLVMGLRVDDAKKTVRPNLDLLASNETLAAAELYLAGRQNRDRVLRDRLMQATTGYDFIVLDCSPSLSLMNQNALVFADSVLVPVACDYLSLVGVRQVIKTVKNVNQLLHHPVQIWGVLPTLFDARANICHEAVSTLKQHFDARCLPPVRAAIKVKEAPAQGQTIFEYAAGASAADDYMVVIDRLIADRERSARGEGASSSRTPPPASGRAPRPGTDEPQNAAASSFLGG